MSNQTSAFQLPNSTAPTRPQLADVLILFQKQMMLGLNVHHIGIIQQFNAENQTAQVSIAYKKTVFNFDGQAQSIVPVLKDYPPLIDVPVIFLRGGSASLTMPVAQGDECILLFNDRDLDNWWAGLGNGQPATPRLHGFSDAVALVGPGSLNRLIQNFDTTRAVLRNGDAMVGVGPQLVKVANNLYTLNQLLQELITEIKNITVSGVQTGLGISGPIVNSGAFTSTATKLGQLLE